MWIFRRPVRAPAEVMRAAPGDGVGMQEATTSWGRRWWLAFTVPIVLIGAASALLGLLLDSAYEHETADWVLQAHAQDAIDLALGFPLLAIAAWFVARGSLVATFVWLGALLNLMYAYVIYAVAVHFGPLFLPYVATLSLASWAFIGGVGALDREAIVARFDRARPARWTAALLVGVAAVFALLWLAQIVPATLQGELPQELVDTGLVTNPVHVLDLGFFLPITLLTGVWLWRDADRAWRLAPILLTAMPLIGAGILAIMAFDYADGNHAVVAPASAIALLTALQVAALLRICARIRRPEVRAGTLDEQEV
jgi:hypothetical protein